MANKVSIPDNADEAAAMMRVAAHWMQAHAPEMLRAILRTTEDAKDAERYRNALVECAEAFEALDAGGGIVAHEYAASVRRVLGAA